MLKMKIFTLSTSSFAANPRMREVATVMSLDNEDLMQPCLSDDRVWAQLAWDWTTWGNQDVTILDAAQ
ncbi:hypothetical protein BPOR_1255g00020 [Botrytis porri]|uniref:Uncharacterized protein n=1 Tax=Botrytis porri TaxID=87229 RepID=A0A4Z1KID6_9HELO|nr:hypothetical protein BPOR_1255g00020 [Botrytis porri]